MKPRSRFALAGLLLASFIMPFTASAAARASKDAGNEKEPRKNVTTVIVEATPSAAHEAALQALAEIGCKINKDSPSLIEGKRTNKVGLVVGSGGEKLIVAIKDLGGGRTEVTVTTKKTVVGIAGQKNWNDEVAKQIAGNID